MERENFDRSLRAFRRPAPFHPFIVELVSGSRITVAHPEALAFNGGSPCYFDEDGIPVLFDHQSVAQLIGTVDVATPK